MLRPGDSVILETKISFEPGSKNISSDKQLAVLTETRVLYADRTIEIHRLPDYTIGAEYISGSFSFYLCF